MEEQGRALGPSQGLGGLARSNLPQESTRFQLKGGTGLESPVDSHPKKRSA